MDINFEILANDLKEASKTCFSTLRTKYPESDICGYALYSDADATSVSPSMNSKKHLEKMQSEDPNDKAYYRWSPGEWSYEFEGAEFFNEISKTLREQAQKQKSQEEIFKFRMNVYEACVSSLEALLKEGFFLENRTDSVIVFTLSDAELPDIEINWIARLNDEKKAKEFEGWISNL